MFQIILSNHPFLLDKNGLPPLPNKKKKKDDGTRREYVPNKNKGPYEEVNVKRPKKYIQKDDDDELEAIVNERKQMGWKMELLVQYKSGNLIYSTINSCYRLFPKETEEYLKKHKWFQNNSKNKWFKLGYKTDPRHKRNKNVHPYHEFSDDPTIRALIQQSNQKMINNKKNEIK